MSLETQIKTILNDFDNADSAQILEILNHIKQQFQSDITSEYLEGKIQKITQLDEESEKKTQCKSLLPYLDWYIQGL